MSIKLKWVEPRLVSDLRKAGWSEVLLWQGGADHRVLMVSPETGPEEATTDKAANFQMDKSALVTFPGVD